MTREELKNSIIKSLNQEKKIYFSNYALIAIIIGVIGLFYGLFSGLTKLTYQAYLINFVFWTGIAQGTIILSVVLRLTDAKWGRPIMRIAESTVLFLPISFVLYLFLIFGGNELYIWFSNPVEHKASWLNPTFMLIRVALYLLVLTTLSILYVRNSMRIDLLMIYGEESLPSRFQKFFKNLGNIDIDGEYKKLKVLSTIIAISYCILYSLFAIDVVMSLDPHWVSTLFGAYYFIGCFYMGIALTIIMVILFIKRPEGKVIMSKQLHDLGKLLFGFALVNGDFFYSQFLVIWYGNLPEETHYIIERTQHQPWSTIAYIVLILFFVLPFIMLLRKKIKMNTIAMSIISICILLGYWLERILLIAPSVVKTEIFPINLIQIAITVGFMGIFWVSVSYFWNKYPMVAFGDPLLKHSFEREI